MNKDLHSKGCKSFLLFGFSLLSGCRSVAVSPMVEVN
jgi:hypothetical protein